MIPLEDILDSRKLTPEQLKKRRRRRLMASSGSADFEPAAQAAPDPPVAGTPTYYIYGF